MYDEVEFARAVAEKYGDLYLTREEVNALRAVLNQVAQDAARGDYNAILEHVNAGKEVLGL